MTLVTILGIARRNFTRSTIKQYNVILIAFDGLQAKHLYAEGYSLDTTPNLNKFFETAYLFTNAISPAPWTIPTYISIFTSMYPSEHKVTNKYVEYDKINNKIVPANLKQLAPKAITLAEIFKKNGYLTAAFTGDAGASASVGNGQGFDTYYDATMFGGFDTAIPLAEKWLEQNKSQKFFLFLHGYDVYGQFYSERPPYNEYSVRLGDWKYILRNPEKKNIINIVNTNKEYFDKINSETGGNGFFDKIIKGGITFTDELYNLKTDPQEQNNLIGQGYLIEKKLKILAENFRTKMTAIRSSSSDNQSYISIFDYP